MSVRVVPLEKPTPRIGRVSGTRKYNALLQEPAEIGRAKPATYPLPDEDFRYGGPTLPNKENADAIMYSCKENKRSDADIRRVKNFAIINKLATAKGIGKPQDYHQFFRANGGDDRLHFQDPAAGLSPSSPIQNKSRPVGKNLPSARDPTFTYGRPTEKHPAINDLLSTKFQDQFLEKEHSRDVKESLVRVPSPRRDTASSAKRTQHIGKSLEPPKTSTWKLKQFADVPPKLHQEKASSSRPATAAAAKNDRTQQQRSRQSSNQSPDIYPVQSNSQPSTSGVHLSQPSARPSSSAPNTARPKYSPTVVDVWLRELPDRIRRGEI